MRIYFEILIYIYYHLITNLDAHNIVLPLIKPKNILIIFFASENRNSSNSVTYRVDFHFYEENQAKSIHFSK